MEKAGIKAFLISALFVGYRVFVGDERRPFGLWPDMPLWLSHVIVFVVVFVVLFLNYRLMDRWEARREKKKMEKYMAGQS